MGGGVQGSRSPLIGLFVKRSEGKVRSQLRRKHGAEPPFIFQYRENIIQAKDTLGFVSVGALWTALEDSITVVTL